MSPRICLVFAASLALAGCNLANKDEALHDDSSNPYYKQAQQDLDANNPNAAVSDYETALGANPHLAGAEYELGIIYGDKLGDPVGSIYHFRRYLELDPTSNKADEVKGLIDKQGQAFAASLPNAPSANADETAKLQNDNASLKKQVDDASHTIAQLQAQLAQSGKHHLHLAMQSTPPPANSPDAAATPSAPSAPEAGSSGAPAPQVVADNTTATPTAADTNAAPATPATPSTPAAPATPPRAVAVDPNSPNFHDNPPPSTNDLTTPAAPAGPSRTYTVVKGDSLWKIAHKMYPGDTKNGVDKIQDANKDINPKRLKLGQVLIIPQ